MQERQLGDDGGEMTQTHDFGDGNGPVPAHQHPNGGGWVDNTATVAASVYIGARATIGTRAHIWAWAHIGARAHIGEGAAIGEWASIGEWAHIGARATIGERARIGEWAHIGARATIGEWARIWARAHIGEWAHIGARATIGEWATVDTAADYLCVGPTHNGYFLTVTRRPSLRITVGCEAVESTAALEALADNDYDRAMLPPVVALIEAWLKVAPNV